MNMKYMIIIRIISYFMLSLLIYGPAIGQQSRIISMRGVFKMGEYSRFITRDKRVFTLIIPSKKERDKIYKITYPPYSDTDICLSLSLRGQIGPEKNYLGQGYITVEKINRAKITKCHG